MSKRPTHVSLLSAAAIGAVLGVPYTTVANADGPAHAAERDVTVEGPRDVAVEGPAAAGDENSFSSHDVNPNHGRSGPATRVPTFVGRSGRLESIVLTPDGTSTKPWEAVAHVNDPDDAGYACSIASEATSITGIRAVSVPGGCQIEGGSSMRGYTTPTSGIRQPFRPGQNHSVGLHISDPNPPFSRFDTATYTVSVEAAPSHAAAGGTARAAVPTPAQALASHNHADGGSDGGYHAPVPVVVAVEAVDGGYSLPGIDLGNADGGVASTDGRVSSADGGVSAGYAPGTVTGGITGGVLPEETSGGADGGSAAGIEGAVAHATSDAGAAPVRVDERGMPVIPVFPPASAPPTTGSADTTAPVVTVTLMPYQPDSATPVTVRVTAHDDVGVTGTRVDITYRLPTGNDPVSKSIECPTTYCNLRENAFSTGTVIEYAGSARDVAGNIGTSGYKTATVVAAGGAFVPGAQAAARAGSAAGSPREGAASGVEPALPVEAAVAPAEPVAGNAPAVPADADAHAEGEPTGPQPAVDPEALDRAVEGLFPPTAPVTGGVAGDHERIPPTVAISYAPRDVNSTTPVTFTVTATDASGIAQVSVRALSRDTTGRTLNYGISCAASPCEYTVPSQAPGTVVRYRGLAQDMAGNHGASDEGAFRVTATGIEVLVNTPDEIPVEDAGVEPGAPVAGDVAPAGAPSAAEAGADGVPPLEPIVPAVSAGDEAREGYAAAPASASVGGGRWVLGVGPSVGYIADQPHAMAGLRAYGGRVIPTSATDITVRGGAAMKYGQARASSTSAAVGSELVTCDGEAPCAIRTDREQADSTFTRNNATDLGGPFVGASATLYNGPAHGNPWNVSLGLDLVLNFQNDSERVTTSRDVRYIRNGETVRATHLDSGEMERHAWAGGLEPSLTIEGSYHVGNGAIFFQAGPSYNGRRNVWGGTATVGYQFDLVTGNTSGGEETK